MKCPDKTEQRPTSDREKTRQTFATRKPMTENCPERDSKKSARNSFTPQTVETMVAAFVARGGRIDKIPEAVPTTANDVTAERTGVQ